MLKKIFVGFMILCLTVTTFISGGSTNVQAAGVWKEIDSNWKYRVDKPLSDGGAETDWHVHVKGKVGSKTVESSETVKGKDSHGTNFNADGVPKWVQKEVKETSEFKNGVKKQNELEKEREKVKESNISWADILFNPLLIVTLAAAAGYTVWEIASGGFKSLVFG